MNNTITLTKVYDPLNRSEKDMIKYQFMQNETIADLLDNQGNYINSELLRFEVSINGVIVPEEEHSITRLVPDTHVTIIPVLMGFWKSVKSVLRTVAVVALAVAAATIFAPITEAVLFYTAINSVWAAYAVAAVTVAAISYAGTALINAVLPVSMDQPDASSLGYSGLSQSNAYSWNPHNTQQQGITIPHYYGTCNIKTSNIIGVYRETSGSDMYLNALFSLGVGPISPPYDFKVNDQAIANYTGVEVETRLGMLDQPTINRFGDTRIEYNVSRLVEYNSNVTYTTIGSDFDTLEIEVGFPNGVFYYSDQGKLENYTVRYSVEYRKQGDSEWIALATTAYTTNTSSGGYWSIGYWSYSFVPSTWAIVPVWTELSSGGTDPNAHYEGKTVSVFGITFATYRWIGDPIQLVTAYHNYIDFTGNERKPIYFNFRAINLEDGHYEIRVNKLTADQSDTRYGDDFYFLTNKEIINDDFTYPGQALVGLRALSTDQLSGSLSFECKTAGKYVRVRRNYAWTSEPSSNPAWICFDVLTQPILDNNLTPIEYRGYDPSKFDIDRFEEWAAYCDDLVPDGNGGYEKRLTYNGAIDAQMTLWDHAISIAKIGRGVPYWKGSTITVSVDMPSSPVALVTVGNIGIDSFNETFLTMENRAGSIDADFINSEKDFIRDKFTVINPDAPSEWGNATLQLQGVTKASEIWRHCRYYLSTTQNLTRVVNISMHLDAIAFTVGDVINVQHDVPMWGEGGRIVSATASTITLDKEVSITAGSTYVVMVRLKDGTLVQRTATNAPGTYSTISVSSDFNSIPEQYDPYAFGKQDIFVKPMRVTSIEPANDLMRSIYLTDYNESIYNSDYLEPVIPTTNYTSPDITSVTGLDIKERIAKVTGGNVLTYIDISWNKLSPLVKFVEVLTIQNGIIKNVGLFTGVGCSVEVLDGFTVEVKARVIPWIGKTEDWNKSRGVSYYVIGKTALPQDVTNLYASPTNFGGLLLTWSAVSDIDLLEYAIKYSPATSGATWETSQELTRTTGTSIAIPAALDGTYLVKAVDTGLRESVNAAFAITAIPSLFGYNAIEVVDDAPLWLGVKDGVFVEYGNIRLDLAGDFDAITDFDSVIGIDAYGGVLPFGYYYCDEVVELDSIQTCRCSGKILFYGVDNEDLWDSIQDFDTKIDIDGDSTNGLDVKAQISLSQDMIDWSDWYDFVAGDYTGIGFKFRVKLISDDPANYPVVTSFVAAVDMADRIERGKGVLAETTGTMITFSLPYKVAPVVRTTIIGATSGDTEKITNVTAEGFEIQILNAGSGVERTIDWQAIGY